MRSDIKRPLFTIWFGRNWHRRHGYSLTAIIAPFPDAEQVPGELTAALINLEVRISGAWPFVRCNFYSPRRDFHATRMGWCEREWRLKRG